MLARRIICFMCRLKSPLSVQGRSESDKSFHQKIFALSVIVLQKSSCDSFCFFSSPRASQDNSLIKSLT